MLFFLTFVLSLQAAETVDFSRLVPPKKYHVALLPKEAQTLQYALGTKLEKALPLSLRWAHVDESSEKTYLKLLGASLASVGVGMAGKYLFPGRFGGGLAKKAAIGFFTLGVGGGILGYFGHHTDSIRFSKFRLNPDEIGKLQQVANLVKLRLDKACRAFGGKRGSYLRESYVLKPLTEDVEGLIYFEGHLLSDRQIHSQDLFAEDMKAFVFPDHVRCSMGSFHQTELLNEMEDL